MKCVVCMKKPAVPCSQTCEGCAAAYARIYQGVSPEAETTMASKSEKGKGRGRRKAARADEAQAAPPPPPESVDEELTADPEVEAIAAAFVHDAEEAEDEPTPTEDEQDETEALASDEGGEDEGDEQDAAPTSDGAPVSENTKKRQTMRSRRTAGKRLSGSIKRIEAFPWESWGITGVTAALALLRQAVTQLEEIPKGARVREPAKPIQEGSIVRVREKFREKYAGDLNAGDLDGLRIEGLRKTKASCRTRSNEKVFLPLRELETDHAAVS